MVKTQWEKVVQENQDLYLIALDLTKQNRNLQDQYKSSEEARDALQSHIRSLQDKLLDPSAAPNHFYLDKIAAERDHALSLVASLETEIKNLRQCPKRSTQFLQVDNDSEYRKRLEDVSRELRLTKRTSEQLMIEVSQLKLQLRTDGLTYSGERQLLKSEIAKLEASLKLATMAKQEAEQKYEEQQLLIQHSLNRKPSPRLSIGLSADVPEIASDALIDNLRQQVDQLSLENKTLSDLVTQQTTQTLPSVDEEKVTLRRDITKCKEELRAKTADVKRLEASLEQLQEECAQLNETFSRRIQQAEEDAANAKDEIDKLTCILRTADSDLCERQKRLTAAEAQAVSWERKLNEKVVEISTLNEELTKLHANLKQNQDELRDLHKDAATKDQEIDKLRQKLRLAEDMAKEAADQKENIDNKRLIDELKQKSVALRNAESQLETIRADLQKEKGETVALEGKLRKLTKKVAILEDNVKALERDKIELREEVAKQEALVAAATLRQSNGCDEARSTYKNLTQLKNELSEAANALIQSAQAQTTEIAIDQIRNMVKELYNEDKMAENLSGSSDVGLELITTWENRRRKMKQDVKLMAVQLSDVVADLNNTKNMNQKLSILVGNGVLDALKSLDTSNCLSRTEDTVDLLKRQGDPVREPKFEKSVPIAELAEPEPEAEPEQQPQMQPQAQPSPQPQARPSPQPQPKPLSRPKPSPQPQPQAQPSLQPQPQAQPSLQPQLQSSQQPQPSPQPQAQPSPRLQPKGQAQPQAQPSPQPQIIENAAKSYIIGNRSPKSVPCQKTKHVEQLQVTPLGDKTASFSRTISGSAPVQFNENTQRVTPACNTSSNNKLGKQADPKSSNERGPLVKRHMKASSMLELLKRKGNINANLF